MLSENLKSLAAGLRHYAETGYDLRPDGIGAVCAILDECIEDACDLEAQPVPAHLRGELPADVVDLAQVLARRGVRTGRHITIVSGSGPEGGAA